MTVFEYFREQYMDNKSKYADRITKDCETNFLGKKEIQKGIPEGTREFYNAMATNYFGGAYSWEFKKANVTDIKEMHEQKLIGHKEYSNWQARQTGNTDAYWLTKKGLNALYKMYPNW